MEDSLYWVKKLKQIKEIEGFKTDKDLSDFLSVTPVTIHDYMKGVNKQMKSDALKRLRQAGYSYDWLLDDIGEPKKDISPELLDKIKEIDSIALVNSEEKQIKNIEKTNTPSNEISVMEHPFTQHIQNETLLLRELVYKLILHK